MVEIVIDEIPMGKISLEKSKLIWEDFMKKDVKKIEPQINWREASKARDIRKVLYIAVWS